MLASSRQKRQPADLRGCGSTIGKWRKRRVQGLVDLITSTDLTGIIREAITSIPTEIVRALAMNYNRGRLHRESPQVRGPSSSVCAARANGFTDNQQQSASQLSDDISFCELLG